MKQSLWRTQSVHCGLNPSLGKTEAMSLIGQPVIQQSAEQTYKILDKFYIA
jgi:hypothetical protein